MSAMQEKDFTNIDHLFKNHLKDDQVPFDPASWEKMEKLLEDPGSKKIVAGLFSSKVGAIAASIATLLLGTGAFYAINKTSEDVAIADVSNTTVIGPKVAITENHNRQHGEVVVVANDETLANNDVKLQQQIAKEAKKVLIVAKATPSKSSEHLIKNSIDKNTINKNKGNKERSGSNKYIGSHAVMAGTMKNGKTKSALFVTNAKGEKELIDVVSTENLALIEKENSAIVNSKIPVEGTIAYNSVIKANDQLFEDEKGILYKKVIIPTREIKLYEKHKYDRESGKLNIAVDTLGITMVPVEKLVPLSMVDFEEINKEKIRLKEEQVFIASTSKATTGTKSSSTLVESIKDKTSSAVMNLSLAKQHSSMGNMLRRIQDNINNAFDGSQNFYLGASLGVNTYPSFSSNMGYNLGLSLSYQGWERLGLAAEIRYIQSYFNNLSLTHLVDKYNNQNQGIDAQGNKQYSATYEPMLERATISQVNQISVPLIASYNLGKFSPYAGVNLNYLFNIKHQTVSIENNESNGSNVVSNLPFKNGIAHTSNENIFKNKMNFGYVAGVTYDISNALSIDARLQQNLFNQRVLSNEMGKIGRAHV